MFAVSCLPLAACCVLFWTARHPRWGFPTLPCFLGPCRGCPSGVVRAANLAGLVSQCKVWPQKYAEYLQQSLILALRRTKSLFFITWLVQCSRPCGGVGRSTSKTAGYMPRTNDPPQQIRSLSIHGSRLWHLIRLEGLKGFDETWIPDHPCYGHNPEDTTPFHDLFLEVGLRNESVGRYSTGYLVLSCSADTFSPVPAFQPWTTGGFSRPPTRTQRIG